MYQHMYSMFPVLSVIEMPVSGGMHTCMYVVYAQDTDSVFELLSHMFMCMYTCNVHVECTAPPTF